MLSIPDGQELFEFFESNPIECVEEDGYYCYKFTDSHGVCLYFSFHEIQSSIQIRLLFLGNEVAIISEECAEKITIEKDVAGEYMACVFDIGGAKSKAEIHVRPEIKVHWSTLEI